MIVVTTNDIPGYAIKAVYGEVFGVTVRSLVSDDAKRQYAALAQGQMPHTHAYRTQV